jgi:hypothetical protein
MARYEGDFARDGFLIVRQRFAPDRIAALRSVLSSALQKHATLNPESGAGGATAASFFHINNPFYFPPGSPQLSLLLEAAADPEIQQLFQHVAGAPPTFSVRQTHLLAEFSIQACAKSSATYPCVSNKPRELLGSTSRGGSTRRRLLPEAAGTAISSAYSEEPQQPVLAVNSPLFIE